MYVWALMHNAYIYVLCSWPNLDRAIEAVKRRRRLALHDSLKVASYAYSYIVCILV